MSLQLIFISSRFIYYLPSESFDQPVVFENGDAENPLVAFRESLKRNAVKKNTAIGLVLDHVLIPYNYVRLPYIKNRKLGRIVEYEIEDSRLNPDTEYLSGVTSASDKNKKNTEVGVFSIQKSTANELIQICKQNHLDLKWITPLCNILDLQSRQNRQPQDEIQIYIDEKASVGWIHLYKNEFLVSTSVLALGQSDSSDNQLIADRINQKITSIGLQDPVNLGIVLDDVSQRKYTVNESLQLKAKAQAPESEQGPELLPSYLIKAFSSSVIKHPRRINLLKSNHLVLQEIKKNSFGIIFGAVLIGICVILYFGATGYSALQETKRRQELTQILNSSIKRYLPKGASSANATAILTEKLNQAKQKKKLEQKYETRLYSVSSTLSELSALKGQIPSFHLNRFSMNDQSIRFQGTTETISEFEKLREALPDLFSEDDYSVTYNQKNRGGDVVEFSIGIQPVKE